MSWEPLRYSAFRAIAAGRTITALGNAVAPVALAFAVLDLTGSLTDLGLVVGARTLANVVLVLFGGVLADRLPRRPLLVVSTVAAALSQGVVAALMLGDRATIPLLVALSAFNGMAAAFALPTSAALVSQTVPARLLQRANSIQRVGVNAATVGGAAIGGALVAFVGPGTGLAVDAACFLLAATSYFCMRARVGAPQGESETMLRQLVAGWSAVAATGWIWRLILGFLLINAGIGAVVQVLGPYIADRSIGRAGWGLVMAGLGLGMFVGSFVAMRVRARRMLFVGTLTVGTVALVPLVLAFWPNLPALVVAAIVGGVGIDVLEVAWDTSLQRNVPEQLLARVYSYDLLGSLIAVPFAQVTVAPLSAILGVTPTVLCTAGLVMAAVLFLATARSVRTLTVGEPAPIS
jgi:MFS family permease